MKTATWTLAVTAVLASACEAAAADPALVCEAGKLKVSSSYSSCVLKAESTAVLKNGTADTSKCVEKFSDKFASVDTKGGLDCPTSGDGAAIKDFLDACNESVIDALSTGNLIADPVTCGADLDECESDLGGCGSDLGGCESDLADCIAGPDCPLGGVTGNWNLSLPDAVPSADNCELAFSVSSVGAIATTIAHCGHLGGADASGMFSGDTATAVQDASPICAGYRLEASLTFADCASGTGSYVCKDGATTVFTGTVTATRSTATCGDGIVNGAGEDCDGTDFGDLDCSDYGFNSGELACDATCGVDTSGCFNCSGLAYEGACWFVGLDGADCDATCASHGGLVYDTATASIAGSGAPDNDACTDLLQSFSFPGSTVVNPSCSAGFGCAGFPSTSTRVRCTAPSTTGSAANSGVYRVCACH